MRNHIRSAKLEVMIALIRAMFLWGKIRSFLGRSEYRSSFNWKFVNAGPFLFNIRKELSLSQFVRLIGQGEADRALAPQIQGVRQALGDFLVFRQRGQLREATLEYERLLESDVSELPLPIWIFEAGLLFSSENNLIGLARRILSLYQHHHPEGFLRSKLVSKASLQLQNVLAMNSMIEPEEHPDFTQEVMCLKALSEYQPHIKSNDTHDVQTNRDKVLLVTSNLGPGGAERQFTTTLVGLAKRNSADGSEMNLLSPIPVVRYMTGLNRSNFHAPTILAAGLDLERLLTHKDQLLHQLNYHENDKSGFFNLLTGLDGVAIRRLYQLCIKNSPSVVHLWQDETNIQGAIAALRANVPRIVMSARSLRPVKKSRYRPHLKRCYQLLLGCENVSLTNNSQAGARDYEDWLDLPKGTVGVIENGLDLTSFAVSAIDASVEEIRKNLDLSENVKLVGACMRMSAEKRPLLWLQAAIQIVQQRSDVHFICVGDGPFHRQMKETIAEKKLSNRIHLPGHKTPVAPWIKASDIFVNCSAIEGMPNVVIEAQSLGIPVVATDVGGTGETLLHDESGILVPADDIEALVSGITSLLEDEVKRSQFGHLAKSRAAMTFSIDVMLDKTQNAYIGKPPFS